MCAVVVGDVVAVNSGEALFYQAGIPEADRVPLNFKKASFGGQGDNRGSGCPNSGPPEVSVTAPVDLVRDCGTGAMPSFVMYTEEAASSRFGPGVGSGQLAVVRYNVSWLVYDGTTYASFTPRDTDRVVGACMCSQGATLTPSAHSWRC